MLAGIVSWFQNEFSCTEVPCNFTEEENAQVNTINALSSFSMSGMSLSPSVSTYKPDLTTPRSCRIVTIATKGL